MRYNVITYLHQILYRRECTYTLTTFLNVKLFFFFINYKFMTMISLSRVFYNFKFYFFTHVGCTTWSCLSYHMTWILIFKDILLTFYTKPFNVFFYRVLFFYWVFFIIIIVSPWYFWLCSPPKNTKWIVILVIKEMFKSWSLCHWLWKIKWYDFLWWQKWGGNISHITMMCHCETQASFLLPKTVRVKTRVIMKSQR